MPHPADMHTLLLTQADSTALAPLPPHLASTWRMQHVPLLTTQPSEALRQWLQAPLPSQGTLLLTSQAAARALTDFPHWQGWQVIAIGESTAEAARQAGAHHIHLPEDATAHAVLDYLHQHRHQLPQPYVYVRGEVVRLDMAALAASMGMAVQSCIAYHTRIAQENWQPLPTLLHYGTAMVVASRQLAVALAAWFRQQPETYAHLSVLCYSAVVAQPLTEAGIAPRVIILPSGGHLSVLHWIEQHPAVTGHKDHDRNQ